MREKQFTTDITAQQRRDMWEWDLRRRCPWLYENEEVPADVDDGDDDESQLKHAPAPGSAPVAGLGSPERKGDRK